MTLTTVQPVTHRSIGLLRGAFADEPGLDTALSRALLIRASDGAQTEVFRIHVPGRIVAFGKQDQLAPGFEAAVQAARARGFTPVRRLAGGRAAIFHEQTLAFSWAIPEPDPTRGIHERFRLIAGLMVEAFTALGLQAAIGEVPGEYCPGEFSVNLDGKLKVMGVGQRLARHAAHIGGVVVVGDSELVNEALTPVYAALDFAWDPGATGSLQDGRTDLDVPTVAEAIVDRLRTIGDVVDTALDPATEQLARSLLAEHLAQ